MGSPAQYPIVRGNVDYWARAFSLLDRLPAFSPALRPLLANLSADEESISLFHIADLIENFLLRGFNEYLFNTAVIAVLLPLLARTIVFACEFPWGGRETLLRRAILVVAGLALIYWVYQDTLMAVSPGKYFERSTQWAAGNYLKSWSTGFGVKEIVNMLEKEKRPGIVFADSQWGNPRTALEVYRKKRFPNLRVAGITREFLDRNETRKLKEFVTRLGPVHFAIYSADTSERRRQWQTNVEEQMCERREEIRVDPAQMPIVVCQF